jgi:hypothetical protein
LKARRVLAFVCFAALCAGCGGGSGGSTGTNSVAPSGASITAHFSFTISPQTPATASVRRTTYISPSSQSLEIDVAYGTASAVGAQLNLAPLPASCSVTGGVTQCDIAVVAQASATAFVITFFDQPNEGGHVLSTATVPVPVAVNGVADVNATLLPVAASVQLAPVTPLINGIAGSTTLQFTVFDADGNPIAGSIPFSTPVQLVPASPAITFSPSSITSPATIVTVTYTGVPVTNPQVTAQIGTTTFTTQLPISPAGTATPTPAPATLTITPSDIGVTVGGPGVAILVSLSGSTGSATLAAACSAGAQISLSQTSVPAGTPTSVTVTAVTAPNAAVTHACTITGTSGTVSTSIFVDVNENTANINAGGRHAP